MTLLPALQGSTYLYFPEDQLLSARRFPNIARLHVRPAMDEGWSARLSPAQAAAAILQLSPRHLPHLRHLEIGSLSFGRVCVYTLDNIGSVADQLTQLTCLKVRLTLAPQQQGWATGPHSARHAYQPQQCLQASDPAAASCSAQTVFTPSTCIPRSLQVHATLGDPSALHPQHGSLRWLSRCGPSLQTLELSNYAQMETEEDWQAGLSGLTGLHSLVMGFPSSQHLRSMHAWPRGHGHATQLPAVFGTLTALTSLELGDGPWTGLPPHIGALVNLKVSCSRCLPCTLAGGGGGGGGVVWGWRCRHGSQADPLATPAARHQCVAGQTCDRFAPLSPGHMAGALPGWPAGAELLQL
jgi:hypothetical protein